MKKALSLFLALALCFWMMSCAKNDPADKAQGSPNELILGTWEGEISPESYGYFRFFDDGRFIARFGDVHTDDGTYTITEDTLIVRWMETETYFAMYTCELETLTEERLSFSIREGNEKYTYTLIKTQSAGDDTNGATSEDTNDATSYETMILGTWEGQMGFFTFSKSGHFACDYDDLVVGDGEYLITKNTLTISYDVRGVDKTMTLTLVALTEETLSFRSGQYTYVLHKA